jgi:hypothetical protein
MTPPPAYHGTPFIQLDEEGSIVVHNAEIDSHPEWATEKDLEEGQQSLGQRERVVVAAGGFEPSTLRV